MAGTFPAVNVLRKINKINEQISVGIIEGLAVLEAVTITLLFCKTHISLYLMNIMEGRPILGIRTRMGGTVPYNYLILSVNDKRNPWWLAEV